MNGSFREAVAAYGLNKSGIEFGEALYAIADETSAAEALLDLAQQFILRARPQPVQALDIALDEVVEVNLMGERESAN